MRQQLLRTCLGLLAVSGRCVFGCVDQDVAGTALFFCGQTRQIFLVVGAQVIFVHTDARADAVQIENDIFHGSLLLLLETLGVGLVESFDVRLGRVDLLRVVGGIEASHLNFAALVERIECQLGGSVGSERRTHHATHHLAHRQFAADVCFEPFRCQALGADQ